MIAIMAKRSDNLQRWAASVTPRRLLRLACVLAVVFVPLVDYRMSSGSWLALCYVPLLLLASPAFALASYGLLPMFLLYVRPGGWGFEPFWAYNTVYITVHQAFTVLQFLLVAAFALDGILWPEAVPRSWRGQFLKRHARGTRGVLLAWCWVLVLALCFEDAPMVRIVAWIVVFLYLRRQVPAPEPGTKPTLRARLGTVTLSLVSVVLFVTVLEMGARLLFEPKDPQKPCYASDTESLFTLRPGAIGKNVFSVSPGETVEIPLVISAQGLRDRCFGPKSADEFRIVMLGDSFMMGIATSMEDTISRSLERLLNEGPLTKRVTVINAGVGGYGPWQERIILRKRGFPLEPDLVIVQLFPANDIDNSLTRVGKRLRALDHRWHRAVLRYEYGNLWQVRLSEWLNDHSWAYKWLQQAHDEDRLFVRVWNSVRLLPRCRIPKLPRGDARWPYIETELEEWYPELFEGLDLFMEDVKGIREDCDAKQVDFVAFCVPCHCLVSDKHWDRFKRMAPRGVRYERGKGLRVVREELEQAGIPYCEVAGAFFGRSDPDELYYPTEGHFTALGCQLVAQRLRAYLMAEYFPKTGLLEAPEVERTGG